MAKLTTTSYAILGLLARRDWSAYELTKYMQLSAVRAVWPRTESRIYLEFKNLIAHQLATAERQEKQGRKRSVYSITALGRQQLGEWLQEEQGSLRLESEPLLKLLYCDLEPAAFTRQLAHMKRCLRDELDAMSSAVNEALQAGLFFPENAQQNAQLLTLLTSMVDARYRWICELENALPAADDHASDADKANKIYQAQAQKLESLCAKTRDWAANDKHRAHRID